jgi:RNA polymerase sigma-54 factor
MSRPSLSQSQVQGQILGARQLQGIEVLQLPAADLASWLRGAFEGNECLRLEEPAAPLPPPAERRGPLRTAASDRHAEWLANCAAQAEGWREQLSAQVSWLGLTPAERSWVEFLVERLDPSGLLSDDDDSLLAAAADLGLDGGRDSLGPAIGQLQRLEPRGVGGRDPAEALLLQLDPEDSDYPRLCALIEGCLEDLSRNRLPAVARALGLEVAEIVRLTERLAELEPVPIAELEQQEAAPLSPDVTVLPEGAGFRLEFARHWLPTLSLDPQVAALARDPDQPRAVRSHLRRKLGEARQVLVALEQREATLARVAELVFRHQSEFLRHGPGRLRPLAMTAVAQDLGLHPSTVSRAVAGKQVQTPHGILPLRRFFQAAGGAERPGGEGTSVDGLRERLRALFAAEDPTAPLSDDQAVEQLAAQGVVLARRTVAKYRVELGLPSSYRRRRFA